MTTREKVARRRCLMDCVNKCDSADKCTSWKAWKDDTGKQINAFLAAAAEDGWHMVRDEATQEMCKAGWDAHTRFALDTDPMEVVYRAMLADPTAQFEWDK